MSTKRERMNADYAKVQKRLGKTTGASKGKTTKTKVKITPSGTNLAKKRVGLKIKVTF